MISSDLLLPQAEIYNFLLSCAIKFSPMAEYVNQMVTRSGWAVNYEDPTTWKYYLNMVGKYHPSDTLMYVPSLDTRQQILLTPTVFEDHPRTRTAYMPGGQYYTRLCETYPEQPEVIRGILFPAPDIDEAIAASDFTLLAYEPSYLEEAEFSSLLNSVTKFLDIYKERWYPDYLDDEPYFYHTAFASVYTQMAMAMMAQREANIRTAYVHSYHIWNALAAEGISNYSDILDRKKQMLLYDNIDYFKANAGKQLNLIILANRLLDDFGVALYGRRVVQESQTGAENFQLTPQLQPVRIPTNTAEVATEIPILNVQVFQDELFAKGLTPSRSAESVITTERKLGDTTLNSFMTKFLEIRPIAKNKAYAELLNLFLIETMVVAIAEGKYINPVEVVDPLTDTVVYVPPAQLMALYHYAVMRSLGQLPTEFPTKARIALAFNPEIAEPAISIPWQDEILYMTMYTDPQAYLAGLSYDRYLNKPIDFSNLVSDLWLRYLEHTVMDQKTKIEQAREVYRYLDSLCHTKREIPFVTVEGFPDYATWLGSSGLDIANSMLVQYDRYPQPQIAWGNFADAIMSALIPMTQTLSDFGNFTLSDAGYTRLRELFVQMCSYKVVFLDSNRDTAETSPGFKWSTKYGPDKFNQYSELNIVIDADIASKLTLRDTLKLHRGVYEHRKDVGKALTTYQGTFVTTNTKNSGRQILEIPAVIKSMIPTTKVDGVMHMRYSGMGITMLPE
jgi:hypothetical protein